MRQDFEIMRDAAESINNMALGRKLVNDGAESVVESIDLEDEELTTREESSLTTLLYQKGEEGLVQFINGEDYDELVY